MFDNTMVYTLGTYEDQVNCNDVSNALELVTAKQ